MRGRKHTSPSIGITADHIRLRVEATDKLPEDFIGYFIRYDALNKVLRIKPITVSEPNVVGCVSSRTKELRFIHIDKSVGAALTKDGIHEMVGAWNEDDGEFTFRALEHSTSAGTV